MSARRGVWFIGLLCRYLFEGEGGNTSTITGMFDGDATDFAFSINIQESVLIEIASFGHFGWSELNVQRIGVLKIFDLHG